MATRSDCFRCNQRAPKYLTFSKGHPGSRFSMEVCEVCWATELREAWLAREIAEKKWSQAQLDYEQLLKVQEI